MNILRLSLVALILASTNVDAADRQKQIALDLIAVRVDARLVIDCRDEHLPSLRAVGQVLDTDNGSRIYAERERLVHIAHRECMRGASNVAFLRDASASTPALAMVDTGHQP